MITTIEAAAALIADAEVVGVPTDTVYGLAVDPARESAMARLYEVKGRPARKPVGLLASDLESAQSLVSLPKWALDLADEHWPGPLTLVATASVILPSWVGNRRQRTVGIRVPDHETARTLLERTGPLAVTSANLSGQPECLNDVEAAVIFGGAVAGYVAGTSPGGTASTVVDCTKRRPRIIRQGPIEL